MSKHTLNLPPFPPLEWDQFFWAGDVVLRSWAGFQSRRGAYGSVSSRDESDGSARLTITPEKDDAPTPPLPEQVRAFQFLLGNEHSLSISVLAAIFSEYPTLRNSYDYDEEEAVELMPEIERAEQLRSLIGLSNIHVLSVAKDGVAYLGFEFGCTWDNEHGLGVMTHRDRVVEVGGADTSFLAWIAERDAKSHE
jgi:hypothetical protein